MKKTNKDKTPMDNSQELLLKTISRTPKKASGEYPAIGVDEEHRAKTKHAKTTSFDELNAVDRDRTVFEWMRDLFLAHYVFDDETGERKWYTLEDQQKAIDAWNAMATVMVEVVRRIRSVIQLLWAIVILIAGVSVLDVWLGRMDAADSAARDGALASRIEHMLEEQHDVKQELEDRPSIAVETIKSADPADPSSRPVLVLPPMLTASPKGSASGKMMTPPPALVGIELPLDRPKKKK